MALDGRLEIARRCMARTPWMAGASPSKARWICRSSTSAFIFDLLRIMYGSGAGSEVMSRIASPTVGGVLSAALLALLVVPAVNYLWRGHSLTS